MRIASHLRIRKSVLNHNFASSSGRYSGALRVGRLGLRSARATEHRKRFVSLIGSKPSKRVVNPNAKHLITVSNRKHQRNGFGKTILMHLDCSLSLEGSRLSCGMIGGKSNTLPNEYSLGCHLTISAAAVDFDQKDVPPAMAITTYRSLSSQLPACKWMDRTENSTAAFSSQTPLQQALETSLRKISMETGLAEQATRSGRASVLAYRDIAALTLTGSTHTSSRVKPTPANCLLTA